MATTCTVSGIARRVDNTPIPNCPIMFYYDAPGGIGEDIIGSLKVSVTTDNDGAFSVVLVRNAKVRVRCFPLALVDLIITIPNYPTADLAALVNDARAAAGDGSSNGGGGPTVADGTELPLGELDGGFGTGSIVLDADASVTTTLDALNVKLAEVEASAGNGAAFDALVARVTTAETDIDTLETSVAGKASTSALNSAVSTLTAADTALDGRLDVIEGGKGQANGYASLNGSGKLPQAQMDYAAIQALVASASSGLSLNNQIITGSGTPSNATDLVTKAYADALISSLSIKEPVRVATTANITLSGTQTIDGVAVQVGDRVLVKDQSTPSQNGIYVVASGAWARATDADANAEVRAGLYVLVSEGTANGNTSWALTTDGAIVVGTTALTFTQYTGGPGALVAGDGLTQTGNVFNVVAHADGSIVVGANDVRVGVISDSQHGTRAGGTLHALADTSTPGFVQLSTDGGTTPGRAVQANDARMSNSRNPNAHASSHATGGADALSGNLDANARVGIYKDGVLVAVRRALNVIMGTNVTGSAVDNAGAERVDFTINASGGGGGGDATSTLMGDPSTAGGQTTWADTDSIFDALDGLNLSVDADFDAVDTALGALDGRVDTLEAFQAAGPYQVTSAKGATNGYAGLDGSGRLPSGQLTVHTHAQSDVTNLVTDLAAKEATANKNQNNGYAGLNSSGKVAAAQLAYTELASVIAAASAALNVNNQQITGVATPTNASDAVTKAYADGLIAGLSIKAPVRAATTANITLSGTQTIDGVALQVGDRVLVKDQSTGSQNGIYVVASGAWSRATDADASAEVKAGLYVLVSEGTTQGNSSYALTTDDPITVGSTALVFTQYTGPSSWIAGAGLTQSGQTMNVVANADGSIVVNANDIQVGVLANDTQHGTRGGGNLHADVVAGGASGFMTGADKTKLNAITGTNTGDQTITLTGDVTGTGTGSFAATVANDAISNAKAANMANGTIKGRTTAGTGDPEDLSGAQATALLSAFTGDSGSGGVKGLVPAPSAGDAAANKVLGAGGGWVTQSGGGGTAMVDVYHLMADNVITPDSNWTISAPATLEPDTNTTGWYSRCFDQTSNEGVGFDFYLHPSAATLAFYWLARAKTSGFTTSNGVQMRLHFRENGEGSWTTFDFTPWTLSDVATWQRFNQTAIAIATIGLTAGRHYQMMLSRVPADADDTLTRDLCLRQMLMIANA